jgi:hypothetical protein
MQDELQSFLRTCVGNSARPSAGTVMTCAPSHTVKPNGSPTATVTRGTTAANHRIGRRRWPRKRSGRAYPRVASGPWAKDDEAAGARCHPQPSRWRPPVAVRRGACHRHVGRPIHLPGAAPLQEPVGRRRWTSGSASASSSLNRLNELPGPPATQPSATAHVACSARRLAPRHSSASHASASSSRRRARRRRPARQCPATAPTR